MDTMPFRWLGEYKEGEIYCSGDIVRMPGDNRPYVMLSGEWYLLRETELEPVSKTEDQDLN